MDLSNLDGRADYYPLLTTVEPEQRKTTASGTGKTHDIALICGLLRRSTQGRAPLQDEGLAIFGALLGLASPNSILASRRDAEGGRVRAVDGQGIRGPIFGAGKYALLGLAAT